MGADMIKTTKQQRIAIKRKATQSGQAYLELRKAIKPTFGCDGAIIVQWCNMWLCIERDGYCHT
jgi:hypothetical protein